MIYLDNAATTLKKPPCVAEAVVRAMATMGNSGRSAHQEALDASRVIYRTREQLARLLGCSAAERVVFTCNSTEALNIAIDGLFAPGDHVLSTDCEHNSVLRPLYRLEGVEVDFLPADRRGCIDYDDFRRLLRPNTRGIICTHGSNLTGNLLDIRAIGRFAKEHGLLLVVDASQTAGVFDIDMEATSRTLLPLDMAYAMTVHKAQGSEYRAVVLVSAPAAASLMVREVLYTAITRARELLVMVGDDVIPGKMAENDRQARRYSGLRRRLMQGGGSDGASG